MRCRKRSTESPLIFFGYVRRMRACCRTGLQFSEDLTGGTQVARGGGKSWPVAKCSGSQPVAGVRSSSMGPPRVCSFQVSTYRHSGFQRVCTKLHCTKAALSGLQHSSRHMQGLASSNTRRLPRAIARRPENKSPRPATRHPHRITIKPLGARNAM